MFFLTLFSIIGVNLWADRMDSRCRNTIQPVNGTWIVSDNQLRLCSQQSLGYGCAVNTYCGSNYEFK